MDQNQFYQAAPLGYLIHEVSRQFRRRFEEYAKGQGVTLPQWKAMAEIARNPGITQVALAAAADSDPMTMSGILDRLEKRGFVERSADPRDSRAKIVNLAPGGAAVVERARAVGLTIYARATEGMGADEEAVLRDALERIRGNLAGMDAEEKESA
ncbi:MAG TPA: MarR family transcriptional regulator [Devosia sp.]|nr:MarR family transcriptional regulator [Devosia sp.]